MSRITLFLFTFLLAFNCLAAKESHELTIHFETDQSKLTQVACIELDLFLEKIVLIGDYAFRVLGHTDSEGSLNYNESLSLARAEEVRAYLVAHQADPELITIDRFGERDPLASNFEPEGKAKNRRVQLVFERYTFSDLDDLRSALAEGTVQHFTIDPTKPQIITGTAGIQLALQAYALVNANGIPATGPVSIELTEAVELQAMLAHQLSTRSGSELLETGGMLNVVATDSLGNQLKLMGSLPMNVTLPSTDPQAGMELFTSNDGSDWSAARSPIITAEVVTWSAPPFPLPPTSNYKLPHYRLDLKGRPMKPSEPMEPRIPVAPRAESYSQSAPWWAFLMPEKANAQGQARYAAAMDRYYEELEDHALELVRYEERCSDFPDALERYDVRKAAWDQLKIEEYAAWHETKFLPARAEYERLMAPKRAEHAQRMEEWKQARDASMARYVVQADSIGSGSIEAVRAYTFATSNLGWINCDRFMEIPDTEKQFIIARDDRKTKQADVFVVFTSIRSMLGMQRDVWGNYRTQAIPKNEPATIFAYTIIDGRPHVCMRPIDENGNVELEYTPSSFTEIGRMIKSFEGEAS